MVKSGKQQVVINGKNKAGASMFLVRYIEDFFLTGDIEKVSLFSLDYLLVL
jgi:hypothetical protein